MLSIDQRIGIRIRGKRLAVGLATADLAQAVGLNSETIEAYERGTLRVPSEHLVKLADVLGVTLSYFML
jgi:transcriptional regulator with XRE-family HTH domain